jgi:hypothetical protein
MLMLWILAFYEILPAERIDKPPIATGVKTAGSLANDDPANILSIIKILSHFYQPLLLQCEPESDFAPLLQAHSCNFFAVVFGYTYFLARRPGLRQFVPTTRLADLVPSV